MKINKLQGQYDYEDSYKIKNDDSYFNETLKWEADISADGSIKNFKIYNENNEKYDYRGKFVNKLDKTVTLLEDIKSAIKTQNSNIKHNISIFKKNTFTNPLNSNDLIVTDDNDNMGAFQLRQIDNDTFLIEVLKKITPNGLSVAMKHLCNIADENNIKLVKLNKGNNETMNAWYKANGFVIEDNRYIRYPK